MRNITLNVITFVYLCFYHVCFLNVHLKLCPTIQSDMGKIFRYFLEKWVISKSDHHHPHRDLYPYTFGV